EIDGIRVAVRSGEALYRAVHAVFNRGKRRRRVRNHVVLLKSVPCLPKIGEIGARVRSGVKSVPDERDMLGDGRGRAAGNRECRAERKRCDDRKRNSACDNAAPRTSSFGRIHVHQYILLAQSTEAFACYSEIMIFRYDYLDGVWIDLEQPSEEDIRKIAQEFS